MNKRGEVKLNDTNPEPHELATFSFLAALGYDIDVIRASHTPKTHSPDFLMNGIMWETKSLTTTNKEAIRKTLSRASKQSPNIIIDFRDSSLTDKEILAAAKYAMDRTGNIKRFKVILHSQKIVDIPHKNR